MSSDNDARLRAPLAERDGGRAPTIIATLIGNDTAQAGDIVSRGRSPVFALCRALLAAGANPDSPLECYRGGVLALTVRTIGIGAKLTIKENDWVGPKVVLYEPLSRDRVGRHARQNGEPVGDHPTTSTLSGERGGGGTNRPWVNRPGQAEMRQSGIDADEVRQ
jgi:hypothetical protein